MKIGLRSNENYFHLFTRRKDSLVNESQFVETILNQNYFSMRKFYLLIGAFLCAHFSLLANNEDNCGVYSGGSISVPSSVCSGSEFTIENETSASTDGTPEYAWVISLDGPTWSASEMEYTNSSTFTTSITQTTWFRRCVGAQGCGNVGTKESEWIEIAPADCVPCALEVELGDDLTTCSEAIIEASVTGQSICKDCTTISDSHSIGLDIWNYDQNGVICYEYSSSTTHSGYSDVVTFDDPIENFQKKITSIDVTFNVAACYGSSDNYSYPIELNGTVIGYYNPTEMSCIYGICEANPNVTFNITSNSLNYNYNGSNTLDLNFGTQGAHICVANVQLVFNTEEEQCVDAPSDVAYLWSNGETTQSIVATQSGTYIVTATDCNGCVAMDEIQVTLESTDDITPIGLVDEVTISQGEDYPAVTFDNGELVSYEEYDASSICKIELSSHSSYNWRNLWFHSFPETYNKNFLWDEGYVVKNEDGTAEIFGKIVNIDLPESGFHLHYYFEELVDFTTWIGSGGYQNTDVDAADRLYARVDFSKPNSIIGFGVFADSNLELISTGNVAHMDYGPRDVYGGFGVGFWIDYQGTVNGMPAGNSMSTTEMNHNDMYSSIGECFESPEEDCQKFVVRRWTVRDNCGKECSYVQAVTVTDTESPIVVSGPEDMNSECSDAAPEVVNPEFSDNNEDDLVITFTEESSDLSCGFEIVRTWTATDACGNSTQYVQTITANDTEAPELLGVPVDEELQCGDELSDAIVVASDNCDESVTVSVTSETVEKPCGYEIVRTWTASDECGNEVSQSQKSMYTDNASPQVDNEPLDKTVECVDEIQNEEVTFTDNCEGELTVQFSEEEINQTDCGYDLVRTWIATDECGNETAVDQIITINDITAPELAGVPADASVECDAIPTVSVVTASDNCDGNVEVTYSEQINDETCPYTIVRTWTATDDCGNTNSSSQTISVTDSEAPVLTGVPADTNATMSTIPSAAVVTATDNCSEVGVEFNEVEVNLPCGYQIVRTWSVEDACGNRTEASQTITVSDDVPPTIVNEPADITVECGDEIPASEATFSDDADTELDLTDSEERTDLPCGYEIVRTWTATDDCGNTTEASQTITVVDTTAPELMGVPADEELECGEDISPAIVVATDNCDESVTVSVTSETVEQPCGFEIIRTWSATDVCGNTASQSQTSTYVDNTDPVVVNVPADVTIECGDAVPEGEPTFSDNCVGDITVQFGEENANETACGYDIVRTWRGTDRCGNLTIVSQTITIVDTTAPELAGVPGDTSAECDAIPAASIVIASDSCDGDVEVTYSEQVNDETCPYTIVRTWTTTDDCGNTNSSSQTISVTDSEAPVLTGVPADTNATMSTIPSAAVVTATDNCSEVGVEFNEVEVNLPCGYQIVRTWSVEDACGNRTEASQTITVSDDVPPTIVNEPADITVECGDEIPASEATFSDDADTELDLTDSEERTDLPCGYEIVRTWTATDDCGNTTEASQTITVVDTTAPELMGVPADEELECGEDISPAIVVATDNCDESVTVSVTSETVEQPCGFEIIRTWSATDVCGNTASQSQTSTYVDNTDPVVVNVPADVTIECGDAVPEGEPTFSDNCVGDITVQFGEENANETACGYDIVRTWRGSDRCGNLTIVSQTITIVDTTAPELAGVPGDTSAECDAIPAASIVIASDSCDGDVEVTYSEQVNDETCPYTIVRTWTTTDDCGNTNSSSQTISVTDSEAPVLTGVPADTNATMSTIPSASVVTATDNCSEVGVEFNEVENNLPCGYQIVRTWSVEDACGNRTEASQTITVSDDVPPTVVNEPADITVECGDEIPASEATFSDDADTELDLTDSEERTDLPCGYEIVRTWTATDDCGNTTEASQTITVVDTTAPELMGVPADEELECGEDISPAIVVATDNCDESVTVSVTSETVEQPCGFEIVRTWSATDACGNTISQSQTSTYVDNTDPVAANVPADVTIECGDAIPEGEPTFSDNCIGDITVQFGEENANETACGYDIVRTWRGSDRCGNLTIVSQTIAIVDTTAPELAGVPGDTSAECDAIPASSVVTASDICDGNVEVTYSEQVNDETCPYTIVRTWTAIDDCGNASSSSQTITVGDSEAPVLIGVPESVNATLSTIPSVVIVTATDNCSEVEVEFNEVENSLLCGYEIIRTWSVEDACGNRTEDSQTITVSDDVPPTIVNEPADITVECGEEIPESTAVFTDESDTDLELTNSEEEVDLFCGYKIVRTWTATDDCGNTTEASQTITVVDTTAPELMGVPTDEELECGEDISPAIVVATDNCDESVTVSVTSETVEQPCGFKIIRTWSATDVCGNTASQSQTSTYVDNTDPVAANVPADVTIECGDAIPEGEPTFSDNCIGDITVQFGEENANETACGYDIVRTWRGTDRCGNLTIVSQTITIVDTTAPELAGVPADASVECDAIPAASVVTASDNCDGNVAVTYSQQVNDETCPYTIVRTWTATDVCGNTNSSSQIISVTDSEAPVLFGVPENVNATMSTIPPIAVVTATDNCSNVEVEFNEVENNLPCGYQIVRTWSVEDACGNRTEDSQTITVSDDVPPTIVNAPADITVECGEEIPASEATFLDDADTDLELTASEERTDSTCGYEIVRTWTATDDCGNTTEASQTISVVDTTAPELIGVPADEELECGEDISPAIVVATDNCDESVTVSVTSETVEKPCGFEIVRTWSATDACGNDVSQSQTSTYVDNTDPVVANVPADVTVECGDDIPEGEPTFSDNCEGDITVQFGEENANETDCGYDIVRTWRGSDRCGNLTIASQTITIVDTTAPELAGVPADTSVECDAIPAASVVTASDVCDGNVEVTYSEQVNDETCPYTIVRTWTATDVCGNTNSSSQTISVTDSEAPALFGVPSNVNATMSTIPSAAVVTATDNCSAVEVEFNEVENNLPCGYQIVRTWSVEDACGNRTEGSQTITVSDDVPPMIVNEPADITVECGDEIPASEATFSDDADTELELTDTEERTELSCGYEIVRTWTATDDCGNTTEASQTITVVDTTAPELMGVPTDEELECGEDISPAIVVATDNCDESVTVSVTSETVEQPCGFEIVRTWSATDACGNTISQSQTSTYVDNTDPVAANVPADVTIECGDAIPEGEPTFSDNCIGDIIVQFGEENANETACGYDIVRTWRGTDRCGNLTIVSQTITIVDTTAPELAGVPADTSVECDAIPAASVVTATDNCDGDVAVTYSEQVNDETCPYTIVRTWTATDVCGNTNSSSQTISVTDSEAPVLFGVPANVNVTMSTIPLAAAVTATDNCSEVEVQFSETENDLACGYEIIRTWSTEDACGNVAEDSQTLTVSDDVPPTVVSQPIDITIECGEEVPASEATFTDDTDPELDVNEVESIEENQCGYVITRSWVATDNCGNSTTAMQEINVVDTTAPELAGVPVDEELQCGDELTEVNVTATDNCDQQLPAVTVSSEMINLPCGYQVIRTWKVSDSCGNEATGTQTSTYIDTTAPEAVSVPNNITVECGDPIPAEDADFTDNCEGDVEVSFTEASGNFNPCGYDVVRTWTATDVCGNQTEVSQTITIVDTISPVLIDMPDNEEVSCDNIPQPVEVSATDNCDDDVSVNLSEVVSEGCPYTITRTWSATDACGNTISESQVITVIDTSSPTITSQPEDLELECGMLIPEGEALFTDNCDENVTVTFASNTQENTCGEVITNTWTAEDACGNVSVATQIIRIVDTTAPTFDNTPENANYNCGVIPEPEIVTASDICSEVQVDVSDSIEETNCGITVIRTWTATDACGNQSSIQQALISVDSEAPVATSVPEDLELSCEEAVPSGSPVFTDNCSEEVSVEFSSALTDDSVCGYTRVNTWTATDACGNEASVSQTIVVRDATAPVFTSTPENITVECNAIPTPTMPDATDNCDNVVEVTIAQGMDASECPYNITRTWTATDDCGNTTEHEQVITVVDTTAPVLSGVPVDAQVECTAIPEVATVTATDNCDFILDVEYAETVANDGCIIIITRTWSVTDKCGNLGEGIQVITVVDTQAPTLHNIPGDVTVDCSEIPNPAEVSASDDCTDDIEVNLIEEIEGLDCGYLLHRRWTAIDLCGNESTEQQTITVLDTQAPVISDVPEDLTIECDVLPPFGTVTAIDECGSTVDIQTSESQVAATCGFVIIRTWTATDNCGNQSTASQEITITDTTSPIILEIPADVTVTCTEVPEPEEFTATDNCDDDLSLGSSDQIAMDGCNMIITRVFRATDDCGNTAIAAQTITVIDIEAPVLEAAPADVEVECGEIPESVMLTATDNCDENVDVVFAEEATGTCAYDLVRTWTATDDCGNTDVQTQTIHVVDTTAPDFGTFETEVYVACEEFSTYRITVVDDCDDDVELEYTDQFFSGGCFGVVQRTWIATDNCGNVSTALQFIRQSDETFPELFNVPENVIVQCGEDIPAIDTSVSATDNCDDDVEISFIEEITSEFCPYIITRTWLAEDECGNIAEGTQVITVEVDTPEQVNIFSYPNPFNDSFTVNFSVPQNAEVTAKVVDSMGRTTAIVFEGQADGHRLYEYRLEGLDWEPGSYTLMMVVGNNVHHHKLMVQNR